MTTLPRSRLPPGTSADERCVLELLGPDAETDRLADVALEGGPRPDDLRRHGECLARDPADEPSVLPLEPASTRFISGLPMKLATKRFAGRS